MELFLTLNGIGHGHLSRSLQICRWLRRHGRRPVIFYQGHYLSSAASRQPGISFPAIYHLAPAAAQAAADEAVRFASLTDPAVIIEDTHPVRVKFPPDVSRVLIVRPTDFSYICSLNADFASTVDHFLVCDAPGSPSWPYSRQETDRLRQLPKWTCIGPIFRRPTAASRGRVTRRYALEEGQPLFVFSMGGGGQVDGCKDRENFSRRSVRIAEKIRALFAEPRLLFVTGPLWPDHVPIPEGFEVVRHEPDLHALFAVSTGAVLRPGFNSTWECIASKTPFLPVVGTNYFEPTARRIQCFRERGLVAASVADWQDSQWLDRFRDACSAVLAEYPGVPAAAHLGALTGYSANHIAKRATVRLGTEPGSVTGCDSPRAGPDASTAANALLIRINDVTCLDSNAQWIRDVCCRHRLRASLEVIPYLFQNGPQRIEAFDPQGTFEIGQHGYAHLPQWKGTRERFGEFLLDKGEPSEATRRMLAVGQKLLRRAFAERVQGGYSAPYDTLPSWMPRFWKSLGGTYLSSAGQALEQDDLPSLVFDLDPWDSRRLAARAMAAIMVEALQALKVRGYVGLSLHAGLLADRAYRRLVDRVIACLMGFRLRPELPSTLAARLSHVPPASVSAAPFHDRPQASPRGCRQP